jgi:hypothetical protein
LKLGVALVLQVEHREEILDVGRGVVEAGEQRERLMDGDFFVKPGLLELYAHVFANELRVSLRVDAEDANVTAVGVAQARDALNGSGLPGAVGAEDAEDLAGRHVRRRDPRRPPFGHRSS